jgi:hypothetical protein
MDSIINFIALGAISEIDNYYANSLTHIPLKKAIEENPPKFKKRLLYMKLTDSSFLQILLRVVYKSYRLLYVSFYFYFTPYITTVFSYLIAKPATK